jgi:hypothetical protein
VGTLTQGGARGDGGPGAPASRLPGLQSAAPLGLDVEEAASCRFTNAQSPAPASGDSRGAGRSRKALFVLRFHRSDFPSIDSPHLVCETQV